MADVKRLMREHPQATMVAATKKGVALINVEALHPRAAPWATVPGAFEDNPGNYDGQGQLKAEHFLQPAEFTRVCVST